MTRDEVGARIEAGAVGLWAIGATEQHGPHLATGFDYIASETVVRATAGELGERAIVLPTLAYGCSAHWLSVGATLSLSVDAMRSVLLEVCRSAGEAGLRHLIIVNGHAGNVGAGISAVAELGGERLVVEFVSYWDLVDRSRLLAAGDVEAGIGHGGAIETAIALNLDGVVRRGRIPADGRPVDPAGPGGMRPVFHRAPRANSDARNGVIGDAAAAEPELGALMLELATSALVAHCRDLQVSAPVAPSLDGSGA